MNLAYICTNFNNSDDTVRAVESIRKSDAQNSIVIIVDNKSRADEVEKLRALGSEDQLCKVVFGEENVGYFEGLNIGLRKLYVVAPETDAAIIGNNDLIFPDSILSQVSRLERELEDRPIISPHITTDTGEHQNPQVLDGISPTRKILYDIYYLNYWFALGIQFAMSRLGWNVRRADTNHHIEAREIEQGHGSCYIVGRRFFREYKELWAPSFLFGEERFLSLQLARNGEKVFFDPRVRVIHNAHAAVGSLPSRQQWKFARDSHWIGRKYKP